MKRKSLLFASLVVAAMACHHESTESATSTNPSDTATAAAADTAASSTGTTSTTSTGSSGGTVSSLSNDDKEFVMKTAQGGMAEVALSNLAAQKAANADVKAFAMRMVTDHSKANEELKAMAVNKGLALPTDLGKEAKEASDKLSSKTGREFDHEYMETMVSDHEKTVKAFEKASKDANDPDLKGWTTKTLPTLQDHLKMAKDTEKKTK